MISKASWNYGYIAWLRVSHDFQHRGVAGKLFDKLVERMIEEGVRFLLLDTGSANTGAVKFFYHQGFWQHTAARVPIFKSE